MEQELIDFLKNKDIDARIIVDDKWLVWYRDEWVVFCQEYRKRNPRELYSGQSLKLALAFLKGDN